MTKKDSSLLAFVVMILVVMLIMLLTSCSDKATRQLRRSEKLLNKAITNGAHVDRDTIKTPITFTVPPISFSTTIHPEWRAPEPFKKFRTDSLTATDKKTGAKTKVKIDLSQNCPDSCIHRVYISTYVPPQDHTEEVATAINTKISAGYTLWDMVILALFCLPAGWLLISFVVIPLAKMALR